MIKKLINIPVDLHRRILKSAAEHTNGNYTAMVIKTLKEQLNKYE